MRKKKKITVSVSAPEYVSERGGRVSNGHNHEQLALIGSVLSTGLI